MLLGIERVSGSVLLLLMLAGCVTTSEEKLLAASIEMDRLEAEIAKRQDELNGISRPRRHFVGARSKDTGVAIYMEVWRQKVEKVGNQTYPKEAVSQKVYGTVQLTTSIRSDGSLEKVVIDRGSGHKVLDEHALNTATNAAPYIPFSKSMKDRFDILSITRTWTYIEEGVPKTLNNLLN